MKEMSYLNFESEILLHVFDDQNQKWKFDAERLFWISGTRDVGRAAKRGDMRLWNPSNIGIVHGGVRWRGWLGQRRRRPKQRG